MKLAEKFEIGAKNQTYQRIDESHSVNIYVGYNEFGKMSLVITELGREDKVKSSKTISVNLNKREDGKMALSFDLEDMSFKQLFLVFCNDIILNCKDVGSSRAIESTLMRWKFWREMFGNQRKNLMDKLEIKGLIGELIVLKKMFLRDRDEFVAIESWMGPLLGHKDFEIDDTWYEVKSINENAILITISSLEQLESDKEGHLIIVRLEETSAVVHNSINLNNIVASIIYEIKDPINLSLFLSKLDNVGYVYDEEYDLFNFANKGIEMYGVTDKFPRLRRAHQNKAIGNAKYTILLDGIAEFKEE